MRKKLYAWGDLVSRSILAGERWDIKYSHGSQNYRKWFVMIFEYQENNPTLLG